MWGTVAILILTVVRRSLSFRGFKNAIVASIRPTGMILMLVAGSTVLGHFIAMTQIPMLVAEGIAKLALPPWLTMTLVLFIYLAGGSFVDDLAFMILVTPIFYPAVTKLGYDPIWFCGVTTPPKKIVLGTF